MQTPPLQLFANWFSEAKACAEIADASAMALATADAAGRPSVRMVLLKHFDERGFVFYTNLESQKSRDLAENPRAALCFHWAALGRQVRVEGAVAPVEAAEADEYFATRPRLSQLGAWASRQSQPLANRYALETAVAWAAARYGAGAVPRPPHWSGFRVAVERIEFWREGAFRHHERSVYVRAEPGGEWVQEWIFP